MAKTEAERVAHAKRRMRELKSKIDERLPRLKEQNLSNKEFDREHNRIRNLIDVIASHAETIRELEGRT